jgi:hypothetical protein
LLVILAYVIGCIVVIVVVEFALMATGLLSPACMEDDRCLRSENSIMSGLGLLLIAAFVVCIIQGWRGRLYGARARPLPPQVNPGTPS